MQRLIIQYTVGDGYTYSSEVTLPIVYESAEKALVDIELQLNHYLEEKNASQAQGLELEKIRNNLSSKIIQDQQKSEKKQNLKLLEEFQTALNNCALHYQRYRDASSFTFGGQTLDYEDFLDRTEDLNNPFVTLPNIYTLDEFFKEVEQM